MNTRANNITTTGTKNTGTLVYTGTLNTLSTTKFGYLNNVSGDIQTQINGANKNISTSQSQTTNQSYSGWTICFGNNNTTCGIGTLSGQAIRAEVSSNWYYNEIFVSEEVGGGETYYDNYQTTGSYNFRINTAGGFTTYLSVSVNDSVITLILIVKLELQ